MLGQHWSIHSVYLLFWEVCVSSFCCCVMNHTKCSGSKEQSFVISHNSGGLTRFSWVVLPFPMKLVGATVIWRLDWTGLSKKAPSHDWVLTWAVFRASVLFLWLFHMARLPFSRGVFILTASVLWVNVPRRRKWTLSVLLCSDLKILRTWLLLPCIGQSSPSASLDFRRGHDSVGSGHGHAGVRD